MLKKVYDYNANDSSRKLSYKVLKDDLQEKLKNSL